MSASSPPIEQQPCREVETAWDEHAPSRDQSAASGTGGFGPGINSRGRLAYGVVAAVTLAFCLVNSFSAADDAARFGHPYRLDLPLFYESTSAVATLVLLPLMRRGTSLVRAGRNRWIQALWAAVLGGGFAAAHISGMVALRKLGAGAVGSTYLFDLWTEVPYEVRKDLVSAILIGMAFWVLDRPRQAAHHGGRPEAVDTAPNPLLWLRDGATSVRVDAREVIWVASAGNYIEYALAGRRHLIRGTLSGEEARLAPFGIVRVHRGRLLNLGHAVMLEPRPSGDFTVRMDTGEVLSGSRRYRAGVRTLRCSAAAPD